MCWLTIITFKSVAWDIVCDIINAIISPFRRSKMKNLKLNIFYYSELDIYHEACYWQLVTFLTEEEANTFLANIWDVTVKDFEFTDNRVFDDY